MTADDGTAAVHVVLAGAVQPDAESTGRGDPLAYRQARGAVGGTEPAEDVIRRIRDVRVWQCECVPNSMAAMVCYGDKPECWANGNGEPPPVLYLTLNLRDPALEERLGRWYFDSSRLGWTPRSRDTAWEHDPGPAREASLAWARELLKELRRAAL